MHANEVLSLAGDTISEGMVGFTAPVGATNGQGHNLHGTMHNINALACQVLSFHKGVLDTTYSRIYSLDLLSIP